MDKISSYNGCNAQMILGNWTSGPHIPECFTSVPPHCVKNGKLLVLKSSFYIYHPEENIWSTVAVSGCTGIARVNAFITDDTTLFFPGKYWIKRYR